MRIDDVQLGLRNLKATITNGKNTNNNRERMIRFLPAQEYKTVCSSAAKHEQCIENIMIDDLRIKVEE